MLGLVLAAPALRSAPLPVGSTSSLRSVQRVAHVVLREDALGPPRAAPAVPPPPPQPSADPALQPEGATTTADGASLPPDSFLELIEHAAESTRLAIAEGSRLLEVEFPPLATELYDLRGVAPADFARAEGAGSLDCDSSRLAATFACLRLGSRA